MTQALVDTSVFIGVESGRSISGHLLPDRLAASMVTVGELRVGVLASSDIRERTRRLDTLTWVLALDPIPVDERVAVAWSDLRVRMRLDGRRLAINDSWIAATAIAHGLTLVTQDQDFVDIPGLDVIVV